ncbi:MAG: glutamate synthase-related protein [Clostridia bacterium]
MAIYKCIICGHDYDEQKEGVAWEDLPDSWCCPLCGAPKSIFKKVESEDKNLEKDNLDNKNTNEEKKESKIQENIKDEKDSLAYIKEYAKVDCKFEPSMKYIQKMALTGEEIIEPMGTLLPCISWDDILVMGTMFNPCPLEKAEHVSTKTIIGKKAKTPLVLDNPIYISHMSFGALSKETKIAMAKGSAISKTAMCSGEGGMLPEEFENSYKYIFEYVPNLYSVTDDNLKKVDAIEIKIGQGTKPGMGGHLPGAKVTEQVAQIRSRKIGEDIISPSSFKDINTKEDLKSLVENLREKSEGKPIGIKIAAGHIEKDLEYISYAKPDFVTIDGRGGATGASPKFVKDSTSIPTIFALHRAKKYIDENKLDIDLVITGGLRLPSDFAKAIAMGAEAVAIASSAMMAVGCQQYRVCNSGTCPMGIATQDEKLRTRVHIEKASKRVANFLNVSKEELKTFARITGKDDVHKLNISDLCTINSEISDNTSIEHV